MKYKMFLLKNIKVCGLIIGCVLGTFMYNCLFTDFSYANTYLNLAYFGRDTLNVKFANLMYFIMYYELKKLLVINVICLMRHRKIIAVLYFIYSSAIIAVQICIMMPGLYGEFIICNVASIVERGILLAYYCGIEKIVDKFENMSIYNNKFRTKVYIITSLLLSNVIMLGIISIFLTFVIKIFIF